jgi:hypothetical protein
METAHCPYRLCDWEFEMKTSIIDVLARRTDLSTFVVHFTRKTEDGNSARMNLRSILKGSVIEARSPFGPAFQKVANVGDRDSQECVSFSETPLEYVYCLIGKIPNRRFNLSKYGLAFTKMTARTCGVNPVWYVDMTPGHDWLMKPIDELIDRTVSKRKKFRTSRLSRITPFIDWMGTWSASRKEFWWEREWRHCGDFRFSLSDVIVGFAPEGQLGKFENYTERIGRRVPFVDPKWNLERMIAHLCGHTGPLTPFR